MKTKILFIPILILFISACTSKDKIKIADLAESWIISSYEGKDAAYKMVSENMSDEGYNVGARYIGFGFNFNSDAMESDGMIVTNVFKDGPAFSVLKVGDKFVSVNGVSVSREAIDNGSLSFRGKPGEPVNATVIRNGEKCLYSLREELCSQGILKREFCKIFQNLMQTTGGKIL